MQRRCTVAREPPMPKKNRNEIHPKLTNWSIGLDGLHRELGCLISDGVPRGGLYNSYWRVGIASTASS